MNNIFSTQEGTWVQRVPMTLTDEQQTLLRSIDEADKEARTSLIAQIQATTPADAGDAAIAQEAYLENKPTLVSTDVYQLIQADATVDGTNAHGIINYRVNGGHTQIRF